MRSFADSILLGSARGHYGPHQWDIRLVDLPTKDNVIVCVRTLLSATALIARTDYCHRVGTITDSIPIHQTHILPILLSTLQTLEMDTCICLYRCYCVLCFLWSCYYRRTRIHYSGAGGNVGRAFFVSRGAEIVGPVDPVICCWTCY